MIHLGNLSASSVFIFPFSTNDGDGGAVAPTVDGTISVYIDASSTPIVTGLTYSKSVNGVVGYNQLTIDMSDLEDYPPGHDYKFVLEGATIDGNTVNVVLCMCSIENHGIPLRITI